MKNQVLTSLVTARHIFVVVLTNYMVNLTFIIK